MVEKVEKKGRRQNTRTLMSTNKKIGKEEIILEEISQIVTITLLNVAYKILFLIIQRRLITKTRDKLG